MTEKLPLPGDIQLPAERVYGNHGWISWKDWQGTGYGVEFHWKNRSFEKAREFVNGLRLKSVSECGKYQRGLVSEKGTRPRDYPAAPHFTYKSKG